MDKKYENIVNKKIHTLTCEQEKMLSFGYNKANALDST